MTTLPNTERAIAQWHSDLHAARGCGWYPFDNCTPDLDGALARLAEGDVYVEADVPPPPELLFDLESLASGQLSWVAPEMRAGAAALVARWPRLPESIRAELGSVSPAAPL